MKTLKFKEHLSKLILKGEKTCTWRRFDDKNLSVGDTVKFLVSETKQRFATAKLTKIYSKKLGELTEEDWVGHERFASEQEMYETYEKYYNEPADQDTQIKIIRFTLLQ